MHVWAVGYPGILDPNTNIQTHDKSTRLNVLIEDFILLNMLIGLCL